MMKRFLAFVLLAGTLLCLAGCGSRQATKESMYDWSDDVKTYLRRDFHEDLITWSEGGRDGDISVYNCKTTGDYEIEFNVYCSFENSLDFIVYDRKKTMEDNFCERLAQYVTDERGKYNIKDKTLDDIAAYISEGNNLYNTISSTYMLRNLSKCGVTYTLYCNRGVWTYVSSELRTDKIIEDILNKFGDITAE